MNQVVVDEITRRALQANTDLATSWLIRQGMFSKDQEYAAWLREQSKDRKFAEWLGWLYWLRESGRINEWQGDPELA